MADKLKLSLAILLIIAGIAGYYALSEQAMVIRVAAVMVGIMLAMGMAWFSESGKRFLGFSRESWLEAKKVVWPTRKETLQTTGVVFLLVIVIGLFLWIVDASLLWAVKLLMGRGE